MSVARVFVMLALLAMGAGVPSVLEAWHPFLLGRDGIRTPLANPSPSLTDEEWLTVGYTTYSGPKTRFAVVLSEAKTPQAQQSISDWVRLLNAIDGASGQPTDSLSRIEDLVLDALDATNRVALVEPSTTTRELVGDHAAGASGRVEKLPAAQTDPLQAVDFIVEATILELDLANESNDIRVDSVVVSRKRAFCRLNMRIIDATTGIILQDTTLAGSGSASELNEERGPLAGDASSGFRIPPRRKPPTLTDSTGHGNNKPIVPAIYNAMQSCASKLAYFSVMKIQDRPVHGQMADVRDQPSHDSVPAGTGWHAFRTDKDGNHTALENPPQRLKDKDWLTVGYSDYAAFKPRLGVVFSQEKTPQAQQYNNEWARLIGNIYGKPGQETDPFNHIEDLVRQALGATNRFTMVERTTASADVIGEQDAGASGRIDKKTAARIGLMKGADFIAKVTIVELNPEKESKDIKAIGGVMGSNAIGIGSVGISGKVAFCRLNVRIVDATTGVIAYDMTVDGTASGAGLNLGGGALGGIGGKVVGGGLGLNKKKAPAIADAMQSCANKVAFFATSKLQDQPWQGSVAAVTGSRVLISVGANIGLTPGLTLTLLSKGEAIPDPDDSSIVLGYDSHAIGTLKIVEVGAKFSTCEIVDGGQGVKKGDIVRLERKKK